MVEIRQGGKRKILRQLTGREIEGRGGVGDEVSQSSQVFRPQDQSMVQTDPRHQTSLQALPVTVRQPGQLHEVVISEVRDSLPPDEVEVSLSAD